MHPLRRTCALALVAVLGASCTPSPAVTAPTPSSPVVTPPSTPTASASPSVSPTALDLTEPGAAEALVDRLMAASGKDRAIMVTVTRRDAAVTVLDQATPQTWAWRDGRIQQVPTDITYVSQRSFKPSDFDFADLGALFRAGTSVSGSASGQSLQIVDYSAGLVSMSVSTVPESRTVFFNPDGTLLPTLDFTSGWGLQAGYDDVVGARGTASQLGFSSQNGVHLDSPLDASGHATRRQRTARTPVIVTPRQSSEQLPAFDPARVRPSVVWGVMEERRAEGRFTLDQPWSCVADDRRGTGTPRLYFTVGGENFTTDLEGRQVTS